jgi:hypothetical protein
MIICAFENSPLIPSFLVTKIVYIGYGQLDIIVLFLSLTFHGFSTMYMCYCPLSCYFYRFLLESMKNCTITNGEVLKWEILNNNFYHLSIAVLLVFLYLIAAYASIRQCVIIICRCPQNCRLWYLVLSMTIQDYCCSQLKTLKIELSPIPQAYTLKH